MTTQIENDMTTDAAEKNDESQKMTVADLIAIPSTQPPGQRVAVDGYECGFDDIGTVSEITIAPEANTHPQFFGGEPDTIPNECGVGRHALAKSGDGEIVVYICQRAHTEFGGNRTLS